MKKKMKKFSFHRDGYFPPLLPLPPPHDQRLPQSLVTRGMISVTGFLRFLTKGSSYDDIVTDDDDY